MKEAKSRGLAGSLLWQALRACSRELSREGLEFSHCRRIAPNNVSAVLNRRIHRVHPVPIKNVVPHERNVLWHIYKLLGDRNDGAADCAQIPEVDDVRKLCRVHVERIGMEIG